MSGVKNELKKLLPQRLFVALLPGYHFLRALLANLLYGFPARRMKVIAVTGTNGKTTTVAYIASILEAAGHKVGVSSTAYYQIGKNRVVNDSNMTVTNPFKVMNLLARMRLRRVRWVVLEVTSHALQQHRVWGIPIRAAVMTNLTQDHLDYHGNMETYAKAKARLFKKHPRYTVLNRDDEWYDYFSQFPAEEHTMSFGQTDEADSVISKVKLSPTGSTFELVIDRNNLFEVETHLSGLFNAYNAAAAATVTYLLHVKRRHILAGLKNLQSVPGRMQAVEVNQPYKVIVDYAHTPDALQNVLSTLKELTTNRLILVFGATGERDKGKRPIMGEIAAKLADRIFVTDEEPYHEDPATVRAGVLKGIETGHGLGKTKEIADRRAAIEKALSIARKGDTVVITGMGHQEFMKVGDKKLPWNDTRVVEEILAKK